MIIPIKQIIINKPIIIFISLFIFNLLKILFSNKIKNKIIVIISSVKFKLLKIKEHNNSIIIKIGKIELL